MKRIIVIATTAIALICLPLGRAQDKKTDKYNKSEQEIRQLMADLEAAHQRGDVAALERIWADDYSAIGPTGEVATRAQLAAAFKSGDFKYEVYKNDDIHVRIYGNAAVVTDRLTRKGQNKGRDISGQFRHTRVFVKQRGRWRLVATQVTNIEQR